MARRDLLKIAEWLSSSKDSYFAKGVRTVEEVLPSAIRSHDRTTATALIDELVGSFWYWDRRVVRVSDWEKVKGELGEFVLVREKARGRRDTLRGLLLEMYVAAAKLREKASGGKKISGLAHHIAETVEHCEREWAMVADGRIVKGESKGMWAVKVG